MALDLLVENAYSEIELGRGKSGVVFKMTGPDGKPFARKIFIGHPIANLINTLTTGAPSPFMWNEDAVKTAFYKRIVEDKICRYMSDDRLSVAQPISISWNGEYKAFQMDMEFIEGRKAGLLGPFSDTARSEHAELTEQLVKPQRKYLDAAGFDLWQKGHGNPTWPSNYVVVSQPGQPIRAVQIDDESGGATFPFQAAINPLKFPYYVFRTLKFKRPSFDDVDIPQLRRFITQEAGGLERKLGEQEFNALLENIDNLEYHQNAWKSISRLESGIQFALSRKKLNEEQAEFYRNHPARWYGLQAAYLTLKAGKKAGKLLAASAIAIAKADYKQLARNIGKAAKNTAEFCISVDYRTEVARSYIENRIDAGQGRGRLTEEQAENFKQQLKTKRVAGYLPDFAAHLGIFAVSKASYAVPALYFLHLIDEAAGITLFSGGSIARFAYTSARSFIPGINGNGIPWIALLFSPIHIIGNAAYPLQIAFGGTKEERNLGEYLIYDSAEAVTRKIPFWGGEHTTLEAHANRFAYSGIQGSYEACHKIAKAYEKTGLPNAVRFTVRNFQSAKQFAQNSVI